MSLQFSFDESNVYVINLDHRNDRLESCKVELGKIGVRFTRFPGIRLDMSKIGDNVEWCNSYQGMNPSKAVRYRGYLRGALGCKMSHYSVIELAKSKDLEYVLIFEDDLLLVDNYGEIYEEVKNMRGKMGDDWDIFYIGGKVTGRKVLTVSQCLGYIVNRRAYDKVMDAFKGNSEECDTILERYGRERRLKYYYMELVRQLWDTTDIRTK